MVLEKVPVTTCEPKLRSGVPIADGEVSPVESSGKVWSLKLGGHDVVLVQSVFCIMTLCSSGSCNAL